MLSGYYSLSEEEVSALRSITLLAEKKFLLHESILLAETNFCSTNHYVPGGAETLTTEVILKAFCYLRCKPKHH